MRRPRRRRCAGWSGRWAARRRRSSLYDLLRALDLPIALRDLGMPESGIDRAVELAMSDPYWNPRPLEARR